MNRYTEIPIKNIVINKNIRINYNKKKIYELAESIKNSGLRNPIEVLDLNNTFYEVITGHRRFKAFRYLNEKFPDEYNRIPCLVRKDYNKASLEIDQLIENLQRENLSPFEEALTLKNILDDQSLTYKELSDKIGKNVNYIQKAIIYLKVLEKIKNYVDEDSYRIILNIPKTKIIELNQLKNFDKIHIILSRILNDNITTKKIRELVNSFDTVEEEQDEVEHNDTPSPKIEEIDIPYLTDYERVKINEADNILYIKIDISNLLDEEKQQLNEKINNIKNIFVKNEGGINVSYKK